MKISEKIKLLRVLSDLSQSQFAAFFGIPLDTLKKWESDKQRPQNYVVTAFYYELLYFGFRFPDDLADIFESPNPSAIVRISRM